MAWSWSHTPEAYENARRNLEAMDRETREDIAAEWMSTRWDREFGWADTLDLRKYHTASVRVKNWTDEKINGFIWERMEGQATCENGGHEAWSCPHGCGPHLVPFSLTKEARDAAKFIESL